LSARPLVPFAMVVGFALLVAAALAFPATWPGLAAAACVYAALLVAESIRVARRADPGALPLLPIRFVTMHVPHGLGVWMGLRRNAGRPRAAPERLVAP